MSASNRIPVVDLRDTVSGSKDLGSCPQVKELHSSLSTVGFVFLKNHGIDKQMVEGSFAASREFFALSEESKAVFATNAGCGPNGYSSINAKSSPQPNDMKEFFDICNPNCQDVPDAFGTVKTSLYSGCSLLSRKILHMLGFTLQLKDPDFFAHTHTKMEEGFMDNYTFLRLLNYPPVTMVTPTETGYRCAEHVDYGTFSLLFQDKGGGLQVRHSDGSYINVPCSDDHILMITGRTLGSWTNNHYRPTYHRVPIPEDKHTRQLSRQSMAFFVHPNSDVLVKPLP